MSVTSLSKLISTRKEELARLLEWRGTNFPVVERQNDLRISFIELELEDLEELNNQPQLNENQQIVLDGLKFIFVNYNQEFGTDGNIKYALRDFYWYLGTDYSILENKKLVSMCESYYLLSAEEFAQVLQAFSQWALEQGEHNERS